MTEITTSWFCVAHGKNNFGEFPNSLLRNNGDNTFTDVAAWERIYSENPTQAAVWRDFNNDGWLDLFIGNRNFIG